MRVMKKSASKKEQRAKPSKQAAQDATSDPMVMLVNDHQPSVASLNTLGYLLASAKLPTSHADVLADIWLWHAEPFRHSPDLVDMQRTALAIRRTNKAKPPLHTTIIRALCIDRHTGLDSIKLIEQLIITQQIPAEHLELARAWKAALKRRSYHPSVVDPQPALTVLREQFLADVGKVAAATEEAVFTAPPVASDEPQRRHEEFWRGGSFYPLYSN